MNGRLQRIVSLAMVLFLTLSLIQIQPLPVKAEDNICGDNLTWSLVDGTLTIRGTGDMYNYSSSSIPWKSQATNITQVQVLSGVTSISNYAFYNCSKIIKVVLADTVMSIGMDCFYNCKSMTSITLPSHITVIPYEAFILCSALPSIEIPNSVTTIGTRAFEHCKSFTSVTIPDSVNSLGQSAFWACDNLETVYLGIGVDGLGSDVFAACPNLKAVNVDPGNTYMSSLDGVVYSKHQDTLYFHPMANGTTLTIPSSVTYINKYACDENYTGLVHDSMLKEIYFKGNPPNFGKNCFSGVTATIYYPASNSAWASISMENYGGTMTWKPYDVESDLISITQCQISLEYESTPWTNHQCCPKVTVTHQGNTLKEGVHYTVDYDNNIKVGTATVMIEGNGRYTGRVTRDFVIQRAEQTLDLSITNQTIEVGNSAQITAIGSRGLLYITFTSSQSDIASVDKNGKVSGLAAGTAIITVSSAENENYLPLSKTITVTVIPVEEGPYDINNCQIRMTSGNRMYLGSPQKAYFSIQRGDTYLVENKDYTVSCTNCTNVGTATAVVEGIGNYTGSATFTYEILPAGQTINASISEETIIVGESAQITASGIGTLTYSSTYPDIATVDDNGKVTGIAVGSGEVEVKAAGNRNYNAVSHVLRFKVVAEENPDLIPISECNISLKTNTYEYDGTPKCPEALVTRGDSTLIRGKDYDITYHNNVNAGYPIATVVGMGAYTGSAGPFTYHIKAATQKVEFINLSPVKIKVGESIELKATGIGRITYFTSTYNESLEIGQYTGIVTGLAAGSVEVIALAAGDSNHESGDARISVQVIADQAETPDNPDHPTNLGVPTVKASNTASGISISWNKINGASGYHVYRRTATGTYSRIKTVKDVNTLSYLDPVKNLVNGKAYSYMVQAYDGAVKSADARQKIIRLDGVSLYPPDNTSGCKLVVKWNRNPLAHGYQLQYSRDSKFASDNRSLNIVGNSKIRATISSLPMGKIYYVRVRAYRTDAAGKRYYSAWSGRKYCKITQ